MGSGLSMASVNKIKELSSAGEYNLALDILDNQDLSKSLNPQFLRLCGTIYTETGRYADARHILLMAHRMAPEGKRIIYSLVYLYLKMGLFSVAKRYVDIYMADADEQAVETKQLQYIYNKATGKEYDILDGYIGNIYTHEMNREWTYELCLLYFLQNRNKEAEILTHDYIATFPNEEYSRQLEDILEGKKKADAFFSVFADTACADDDPEQEASREEECKLLEQDELRIHPKEPEIMFMVDDEVNPEYNTKRFMRKFTKQQEREERRAERKRLAEERAADREMAQDGEQTLAQEETEKTVPENIETDNSGEPNAEAVITKSAETEEPEKEKIIEAVPEDTKSDDTDSREPHIDETNSEFEQKNEDNETKKTSIFSKLFGFGKKKDDLGLEDEISESVGTLESELSATEETKTEEQTIEDATTDTLPAETLTEESATGDDNTSDTESKAEESKNEESEIKESEIEETSIEETATENDESGDVKSESAEATQPESEEKQMFVFEKADLDIDESDDEVYEFDDFSDNVDDEFGEMATVDEFQTFDEVDETQIQKKVLDVIAEEKAEMQKAADEAAELAEIKRQERLEAERLEAERLEAERLEAERLEAERLEAERLEAERLEAERLEAERLEAERLEAERLEAERLEAERLETERLEAERLEAERLEAERLEAERLEAERLETERLEAERLEAERLEAERLEAERLEAERLEAERLEAERLEAERLEAERLEAERLEAERLEAERLEAERLEAERLEAERLEAERLENEKKKFPIFKSTLFPNYHKDTPELENNFNEVMMEAKDKIETNLQKEDEMMREAEALLASLGIDLGSVTSTQNNNVHVDKTVQEQPSKETVEPKTLVDEEQTDLSVSSIEEVDEPTIDYEVDVQKEAVEKKPSRDEMKSSLKIDATKKELLQKINSY